MRIDLSRRVGGRFAVGGASVLMLVAVAACGGGTSAGSTGPAAAPTIDAAKAQTAAFCSANLALEAATSGPPPGAGDPSATPEQITAAAKAFAAEALPLATKVDQTAPDAVKQDTAALTRLGEQVVQTGDDSVFQSPDALAAEKNIDEFLVKNCGWDQTKITATDFEYAGAPTTLKAAAHAFTLSNEGEEIHVLALVRINDGVTMTLDELLMLPEEQAMQMTTDVAGAFAAPGSSDTTYATLTPGRYALLCPIPMGSTAAPGGPPAEGTGPPHFVLGMKAELTVT